MAKIVEVVHLGYDGINEIIVSDDGTPVPFVTNGTTEISLEVNGVVYRYTDAGDAVDFADGGIITFRIGNIGADAGTYLATIIVYDPTHLAGQPVVSQNTPTKLFFKFVE